jgi:putative MATE family efflux protein
MMLGTAQGFTQGFSVRIAQKFGEGDGRGLRLFMGQSAVATAALAVLCVLVGQLGLPLFLTFLRVPETLRGMATLYTRILFAGLPAVFFFNYCSAMLRAVGDSKTPLVAMSVAAVTNIILDVIAVFLLDWGIAGAAIATVIAQCVSGVICVARICRTPQLQFSKKDLQFQGDIFSNLLKIGVPAAGKNLIIALGGMAVMTVVNTFQTPFIAGFTSSNKLYGLLEIAALSYGYAIITYVGQNYGAGRMDRITAGMKSAAVLSIITALVIAAMMFLFGRPITMLFISTENPADAALAGEIAYRYLCVMASCLPVLYILYMFLSALQGWGDTVRPMISGAVELAARIAVAAAVAYTGYEMGILGAEIVAWIGAALYLAYHYRAWMKKETAK